ncbi:MULTISPECIES: tetratricopeptide repeat protein [unclassified Nonomuraea]|uniref:tetratricopeptide repeat protein n=1 Tax=unclassified Nonomuraea TaxID=2593643 RepID=UPI0033EEBEDA
MTASGPRRGPFVGARPFDEGDGALFFGRSAETAELAGMWRRNRLTILHGAAGAGKTSLLRAAVIPSLRDERARVLPVGLARSTRVWPAAALPEHNPYVIALLSSWSDGGSLASFAGLSVSDFLRRLQHNDGVAGPTLAAVDQVETFLRLPDPYEHLRESFFDELLGSLAQRPDLRLLLSVRTDHLDELRHVLRRYAVREPQELALAPLTRAHAVEAMRLSAESTGDGAAADKVEELVDEIRTVRDDTGRPWPVTDEVDPLLLQAAGARLWGDPPDRERFLLTELDTAADRAVREFCAETLAEVAADYLLPPGRLMSWFRRDILHEYGRLSDPVADVGAVVLNALEDRYLVSSPKCNGLPMHGPRHPRMLAPLRQLDAAMWPQSPPDPAARLRAAKRAGDEGEPDRARRLVHEAAQTCPPHALRLRAEIDTLSGNIDYDQGLLEESIQHYRAAARLFEAVGDNAAVGWLMTAVGRVVLAQGRPGLAVEQLRAAVGRVPDDLIVQTALGQALWEAGQPDAALAVLSDVLNREADTPEARRSRGEFLADLGDAESALRDMRQLRGGRPAPSTKAARALAMASLTRPEVAHDLGDALDEAEEALKEAEESGPVLLRAARVHKLTGDVTRATELADRAMTARRPPLPEHQRRAARKLLAGS